MKLLNLSLLFLIGCASPAEKCRQIARDYTELDVATQVTKAAQKGRYEYCFNTEYHSVLFVSQAYNSYREMGFRVYFVNYPEPISFSELCINWSYQ